MDRHSGDGHQYFCTDKEINFFLLIIIYLQLHTEYMTAIPHVCIQSEVYDFWPVTAQWPAISRGFQVFIGINIKNVIFTDRKWIRVKEKKGLLVVPSHGTRQYCTQVRALLRTEHSFIISSLLINHAHVHEKVKLK